MRVQCSRGRRMRSRPLPVHSAQTRPGATVPCVCMYQLEGRRRRLFSAIAECFSKSLVTPPAPRSRIWLAPAQGGDEGQKFSLRLSNQHTSIFASPLATLHYPPIHTHPPSASAPRHRSIEKAAVLSDFLHKYVKGEREKQLQQRQWLTADRP